MVQCFAPDCNHQSESSDCSYFRFPKDSKEKKRWRKLLRRADKEPTASSRVCSCHFTDKNKINGPTIFKRNANKIFPEYSAQKKKRGGSSSKKRVEEEPLQEQIEEPVTAQIVSDESLQIYKTENLLLKAELENMSKEINDLKQEHKYHKEKYTAKYLGNDVIRMETGLPNKTIFAIVVNYVSKFKSSICYYAGWKVLSITLEDQVFMTLMKLRQNYTNLHLAQLFHCSASCVSNIVITFIHLLYTLLYDSLMSTDVPSREKNLTSLPEAFLHFPNCKMVVDCTDIKIAIPSKMSDHLLNLQGYELF